MSECPPRASGVERGTGGDRRGPAGIGGDRRGPAGTGGDEGGPAGTGGDRGGPGGTGARGSGCACESDGDDSDGQGAPQGGWGVQSTPVSARAAEILRGLRGLEAIFMRK